MSESARMGSREEPPAVRPEGSGDQPFDPNYPEVDEAALLEHFERTGKERAAKIGEYPPPADLKAGGQAAMQPDERWREFAEGGNPGHGTRRAS